MASSWGSPVERERHRRVLLTLAAYAYEIEDVSLCSDHLFDAECLLVDLEMDTGRPDLDAWWRENFHPSTGMWILNHPELDKVALRFQQFMRDFEP
jgi:hypothetical protein